MKSINADRFLTVTLLALLAWSPTVSAQGPEISYYYEPATELSWAECYIYFDGGSHQRISFLPVVSSKVAPFGTDKYTRDIDLEGPIVFVGNGISGEGGLDCYQDLDVAGKIVLFAHDFPDSVNREVESSVGLAERISKALEREVSGIIVASFQQSAPFLAIRDPALRDRAEVPIVTVNGSTAERILSSAGLRCREILDKWKAGAVPDSRELITKLRLRVKGRFESVETPNFEFLFRSETIPVAAIEGLAEVNESSLRFPLELFASFDPSWEKTTTVYFRDYDSKLFYTHHFGRGLSEEEGTFMVYDGLAPDLGLAVHENTHRFMATNWGGASSFLEEGIATYVESLATDRDKNHLAALGFLKEGSLFPLKEMVEFDIGRNERETRVGYPASGSFVGFLIGELGVPRFIELWKGGSWEQVYRKSLSELERDWIDWLTRRYDVGGK